MGWFFIIKKDKVYEDYLNDLQSWAKNIRLEQDELELFNVIFDSLESYKNNPKKHKSSIIQYEYMLADEIGDNMDNELPKLPVSFFDEDTFEKEAGGVSFGGHGSNPALFNIRYGKKRRKKDDERN
tara:strand:- start:497 stop:874 length:378 start_codon:yes stop_codon:yes gene_type:complete